MFKAILALSAFVALATAAKLRTDPEELHLIFKTVDENVKLRQATAEAEINNIILSTEVLVDNAKERIVKDVEEESEVYREEVKRLEEKAHSHGQDISRCVLESDRQLQRLNDEVIEGHNEKIDRLKDEADHEIHAALEQIDHLSEELEELRKRVERCSDIESATELNIQVVHFYEKAVQDLDDAVGRAEEAALVNLPLGLDEQHVDKERCQQDVERVLGDLRECASDNPHPNPHA